MELLNQEGDEHNGMVEGYQGSRIGNKLITLFIL